MTPLNLEEQLALSIELVRSRKDATLELGNLDVLELMEAPGPALRVVPKPAPPGSEIPAVLSPSSVNTFFDCSVKWFYRKVLRLPETRGAHLGLGTAVHAALLENFRQKIETREDLPEEGVRALFIEAFTAELDTIVLSEGESADDLKQCGEVMCRVYMERAAQAVDPAAVEAPVEGRIGDVPAHGYIDVRAVDGRIIDLKTASRKPSGTMPDYRLQVATYVMLDPLASGAALLSTLTKTKTVDLHQDSFEIGPADHKLTTRLYSVAREQMASGVYAPNRKSFLCSRKYCSYWERCEDEFGGRVSE